MREGVEVLGKCGSSVEDPVPEEPPLNLVLCMHLRIFAYSSNIFMASLDPMASMLVSGTWKIQGFSGDLLHLGSGIFFIKGAGIFFPRANRRRDCAEIDLG